MTQPARVVGTRTVAPTLPPVWRLAAGEDADALAFLDQRSSAGPKYLGAPASTPAALESAAEVAPGAPDHRQLRPLRLGCVGDAEREHPGSLFAADAARPEHGAAEVEYARACRAALILCATASTSPPGVTAGAVHRTWQPVPAPVSAAVLPNWPHQQGSISAPSDSRSTRCGQKDRLPICSGDISAVPSRPRCAA